jgi:hypothetical protein
MKSTIVAFLCAVMACGPNAQAALIDYWPIDEGSGSVAHNSMSGRTDGTLLNSPTWITNDPVRGTVLSFNGSNQAVSAGTLQALALGDSFTWSFWAYQDPAQPLNNDVILGNRNGGTGSPLQFIKFTPAQFEYYHGSLYGVNYTDVPGGTWLHHAVVLSSGTFTYYRNGVASGTSTINFNEDANPFYMGGDVGAGECWQGRIDDVSLWNSALTPVQIAQLAGGMSPLGVAGIPEPGTLTLIALGCLALARRRRRA